MTQPAATITVTLEASPKAIGEGLPPVKTVEIPARCFGPVAVHRALDGNGNPRPDGRWHLTYTPEGSHIGAFRTKRAAYACARELAQMGDLKADLAKVREIRDRHRDAA
jgi:hypothetical protein